MLFHAHLLARPGEPPEGGYGQMLFHAHLLARPGEPPEGGYGGEGANLQGRVSGLGDSSAKDYGRFRPPTESCPPR